MAIETGQRVTNFAGRSGLVVATRISVTDALVSWDNGERQWVLSALLIEEEGKL